MAVMRANLSHDVSVCYHVVMVRTQTQFTESQVQELRRISAITGHSIAHITREALNDYLEQRVGVGANAKIERAISVAGRFASGLHDISADHDRHLSDAFGE